MYDAHRFLITSVDLPVVAQVMEASPEKPYLGLVLQLDQHAIAPLMVDSNLPSPRAPQASRGMAVGQVTVPLLNAFQRLLDLGAASLADKYEGCMVGLAVGDALGFPTEFMRLSGIRAKWGREGVTDFEACGGHPPGTYSDDTQMSLAVARALLQAGSRSLDELLAAVGAEFVAGADSPDNNRAPGGTCMHACHLLASGVPWREAGRNDSKGCGTAMRSAPVGLYCHGDWQRLVEVASAVSLITHGHPCATAGSVATAARMSMALNGMEPRERVESLWDLVSSISSEFVSVVRRVPGLLDQEPDRARVELGEGWVAEEAVAPALYCFLRKPDGFSSTVLTGANSEGDSDSIACLAGAISGAYNGRETLPARWRQQVEDAPDVRAVAEELSSASTFLA